MNVTFRCRNCNNTNRCAYNAETESLRCAGCATEHVIPSTAIGNDRDGQQILTRCMVCPGEELYYRKQFNQRLGIAIIITGFVLSTIAYASYHLMWVYGILFFTAAIDLLFYLFMGNLLQCYKCNSEYRGFEDSPEYAPFSLEVHEKYHQQRVRLQREEKAAAWQEKQTRVSPKPNDPSNP
ncbi:MAG: hypothetical protein VX738_00375 [Planctomycetota bacterium]|nr:hypothetical protein [Planctomycetota bacterium]